MPLFVHRPHANREEENLYDRRDYDQRYQRQLRLRQVTCVVSQAGELCTKLDQFPMSRQGDAAVSTKTQVGERHIPRYGA